MVDVIGDLEIPAHEVVIASSKDEVQQCFDIRVDVFHHEQKFPLDTEFDDKEDLSTHILLRLTPSLLPVGTIRGYLVPGTTDTYKLTRLAIHKDYRKYGFGRKLVDAFHDWVKSHASRLSPPVSDIPQSTDTANGIEPNTYSISQADDTRTYSNAPHEPQSVRQIKINCHSQIYTKGFYSKFGYAPEGEEFIEDGDPHQNMVLHISIPATVPAPKQTVASLTSSPQS